MPAGGARVNVPHRQQPESTVPAPLGPARPASARPRSPQHPPPPSRLRPSIPRPSTFPAPSAGRRAASQSSGLGRPASTFPAPIGRPACGKPELPSANGLNVTCWACRDYCFLDNCSEVCAATATVTHTLLRSPVNAGRAGAAGPVTLAQEHLHAGRSSRLIESVQTVQDIQTKANRGKIQPFFARASFGVATWVGSESGCEPFAIDQSSSRRTRFQQPNWTSSG